MSFADQLQTAKGGLTARQVAAAVSPMLSVRTVEGWLADRRTPPEWSHDWILSRVRHPKNPRRPKNRTNLKVCRPLERAGENAE